MPDPGSSGRTALITGGAQGLGAARVRVFRAEGARVAAPEPLVTGAPYDVNGGSLAQ